MANRLERKRARDWQDFAGKISTVLDADLTESKLSSEERDALASAAGLLLDAAWAATADLHPPKCGRCKTTHLDVVGCPRIPAAELFCESCDDKPATVGDLCAFCASPEHTCIGSDGKPCDDCAKVSA